MIGIIGAMDVEINSLLNEIKDYNIINIGNLKFYKGHLFDKEVVIVKCGVGKVNASFASSVLCLEFKVDLIITTGIAGGTKSLETKDICIANEYIYGDVDVTCFGYSFGQVPSEVKSFIVNKELVERINEILNKEFDSVKNVTFLTQDSFITTNEQVQIERDFLATEMESTAIAHIASKFNVETIGLRIISDVIGKESQIESYDSFEDEAGNISAKMCLYLVKNL